MLFPVIFLLLMLIFDTDTDTAHLDISITLVPADTNSPLRIGGQLQLACNIQTDPAVDLTSTGWLYNEEPFYLFNNHKYIVYYTPAAGTVHKLRSVLTINEVTKNDVGTYSCEVRNPAGMYEKVTIYLGIEKNNHTLSIEQVTRIQDQTTALDSENYVLQTPTTVVPQANAAAPFLSSEYYLKLQQIVTFLHLISIIVSRSGSLQT